MNRLHVYAGDGKGKTTAAMGLALRSLGHGNTVLVAQFLKTGNSGELAALGRFERAIIVAAAPVDCFTFQMDDEQRERCARQQAACAAEAERAIRERRPRTVVLDELGVALSKDMLDEAAARRLVDAALESGETVVTGREVPAWLEQRADYLSRISSEKHPYAREGLAAREGVEW